MDNTAVHLFWTYGMAVIMLLIIGFYCLLATLNLVRVLIGIEILMKAVTLLLIVAGYMNHNLALAQSLVITLIVVETVSIAIAMGIVLSVYDITKSLDTNNLTDLKG
jgi:NADH:ubiquinone oxidoreductase subunit K